MRLMNCGIDLTKRKGEMKNLFLGFLNPLQPINISVQVVPTV